MATSLQFGAQLALSEIARVPHRRQVEEELRRAVLDEKLHDQDEALASRLRSAALVVYGYVDVIEPVTPESRASDEPVAPTFRAAVLRVWRALKGRPEEAPRVVFPFPRTQKWSEVPLFVEGEEGVWLLHEIRDQALAGGRVNLPPAPNSFTALDPLDFHTPGMLSRLEVMLAWPDRSSGKTRTG
jgi:hypothetical protein